MASFLKLTQLRSHERILVNVERITTIERLRAIQLVGSGEIIGARITLGGSRTRYIVDVKQSFEDITANLSYVSTVFKEEE